MSSGCPVFVSMAVTLSVMKQSVHWPPNMDTGSLTTRTLYTQRATLVTLCRVGIMSRYHVSVCLSVCVCQWRSQGLEVGWAQRV